jgi:hypothetical protein
MGKIGIFDEEQSKWIQFDNDTEVLMQLATKSDLRKINQKAAKRAKLTGENAGDISDCLLGRAVVKSWRKITDYGHPGLIVNGQPLPFTPENIDMLMRKSIKFSRFVNETCIDEDEFIDGEETKNV